MYSKFIKKSRSILKKFTQAEMPGKICAFLALHFDYLILILAALVLITGLIRFRGGRGIAEAVSGAIAPELVFTLWTLNGAEIPAVENLVKEFEESHSDIKIRLDWRSYEETKKLLSAYKASSKDAPEDAPEPGDIFAMDISWAEDLYRNEIPEPEGAVPGESLFPALGFFYPLFYNIELLKEAGYNRPPKTWGEFLEFAKAVTDKKKNRWGYSCALRAETPSGISGDVYSWLLTAGWHGGSPETSAGPELASGPAAKTLEFLKSLKSEGVLHPAGFSMTEEEKEDAFIAGKIAFMIGPVQAVKKFRDRMGEAAFSITSIPAPDDYTGKPVFFSGGYSLGIFRQSNNKKEAGVFISFLKEKTELIGEALGMVPGGAGNPPPLLSADSLYSKAWELYISGDMVQGPPEGNAVRELRNALQDLL
ncbi:MAG: extracellular solute-binding protein [Treponema sp.]|jgi:multiple sugar transport system substrate-binding protein|nr:extracellular solute-binding protein [Treponema sp.]